MLGLIMDGMGTARVPDNVIAEVRSREVDGLIELAPRPALRHGARVRILAGSLRWSSGDLRRHAAAPAGRDPAPAAWRRAEGDARQEGHRSGTLTRSARSANSSNGAARSIKTVGIAGRDTTAAATRG